MRYIGLLICGFVLFSCDTNRVLDDNRDFDEAFWHKDSVVSLEFEIEEVGSAYNIYANIRNAQNYPFYNLYYKYTLSGSEGGELEQALENINLFDPKTGEPYGDGLGDLFDHRQLILENYRFPEAGRFSIKLEQFMRRDSLPLILSVGARVEQVE